MLNVPKIKIIADGSYVGYYAAFGAWNIYKSNFEYVEDDYRFDPITDDEYIAIFRKCAHKYLFGTIKKFSPVFLQKDIYVTLDCKKKDIWRNHYYPDYKLKRKKDDGTKSKFNIRGVFDYYINNLLQEYSEDKGIKVIGAPNCEGDDIIAMLCEKFSMDDKLIICSDHDLWQLLRHPHTIITDIPGKQADLKGLTPEEFLLQKILMGDNSDEIPGIFPRTGPKTALKYVQDKELLKRKMRADPSSVVKFKRNKILMDLKMIPQGMKDIINERIEKVKKLENA